MSRTWRAALRDWTDSRLVTVLFLGFASGLPLALTFSTLSYWLTEEGISRTTIGLFALVTMPYTLKFLWAPLADHARIPILTRALGRRRSWGIFTQAGLMVSVIGLGFSDPGTQVGTTAAWAVAVAFFSASQDIVIDALRIEILAPEQQGAGASAIQYGYRVGMLVSSAGALLLAEHRSWPVVYVVMALLVGVGIATLLLTPEPRIPAVSTGSGGFRWLRWIEIAAIRPILDFARRPGWLAILAFILLFPLGEALIGRMSAPFYVEMGFSKTEIATVTKAFGLVMTLVGIGLGGVLVSRIGVMRALIACGIAQAATNLMFAALATRGHDLPFLEATIAVENLAGGMAGTAFVAYLSSLCNVAYTATHYAAFSALASVTRTVLSSASGAVADAVSWTSFFIIATICAVPGLVLLAYMAHRWPPGAVVDTSAETTAGVGAERWILEETASALGLLRDEAEPRDPVRLPVLVQGEHVHERRLGEYWHHRKD
jgi:PAT family beta-lactamase induction signal transducer AmpG